jgi:beta-galactosidase/beta-glucuronidase
MDIMLEDVLLMKKFNFNAVRLSHYPHHEAFYSLCDELGLYVVDEVQFHTHTHTQHTHTYARTDTHMRYVHTCHIYAHTCR